MKPLTRILPVAATALVATFALAGCFSPAAELSGPVGGQWHSMTEGSSAQLEFQEDGSVSGSDGCNRLVGTWTEDGGTIVFGEFITTLMACEDTVPVWSAEPATATIDGGTMVLVDANGANVDNLDR